MSEKCCCERSRRRTDEELKRLTNRLSRVEGQVRGIRKMLEEDAYCIDVITQVSAATSALKAFSTELLSQHLSTCVKNDLSEGSDEKLNEVLETLKKLM